MLYSLLSGITCDVCVQLPCYLWIKHVGSSIRFCCGQHHHHCYVWNMKSLEKQFLSTGKIFDHKNELASEYFKMFHIPCIHLMYKIY